MEVRTIEDNFDYQVKEVMLKMKELADDCEEELTEDFIWKNKAELGEYFFNSICDYMGLDEAIEKVQNG